MNSDLEQLEEYIRKEFDYFVRFSPPEGIVPKILKKIKDIELNKPILWEEFKEGQIYESLQQEVWVKCEIVYHYRGQLMIKILEGNLKDKCWYLFPDFKERLRRVKQ